MLWTTPFDVVGLGADCLTGRNREKANDRESFEKYIEDSNKFYKIRSNCLDGTGGRGGGGVKRHVSRPSFFHTLYNLWMAPTICHNKTKVLNGHKNAVQKTSDSLYSLRVRFPFCRYERGP